MRRLHFGCGPNRLPEPWENFDKDVDIRRDLPFATESAALIFAEHAIEHVPFVEGLGFLRECWRVLEPGGVLRFGFPDVTRFVFDRDVEDYLTFLRALRPKFIFEGRAAVFRFIMSGSGHMSCWTRSMAEAAVLAVGFTSSSAHHYGTSQTPDLHGIDGHHKTSRVASIETTVLEAKK